MNLLAVLGVFALLIALLAALGFWQQKITTLQSERAVADIRDAEHRGTKNPLLQHPQIDVRACIGCGSCVAACPEAGVLGMVDGVAQVIHGARCIGHGLCAEACPVGAVKIGLGDVATRSDIPVLSDSLETSASGLYIAGELGGFALIRIAMQQGAKVISEIASELRAIPADAKSTDVVDVLIVGAGPAGLAATLKAIECGLTYRTIDQDDVGGTVRKYPRRKLTLTGAMDIPLHGKVRKKEFIKEDLIRFWEEIIERYELRIETGTRLLGVARDEDAFVAATATGDIRARRVVLALGRRGTPRKLGVVGEEMENVLYQLLDAASYRNENILVVGGGDSAIEAATALANQPGNIVTVSYRKGQFFRLKSRNAERIEQYERDGRLRVVFESVVQRIDRAAVLLSCEKDAGEKTLELRNDYVFVLAGGEPPYRLLRDIGIRFGGEDGETLVVRALERV